LADYSYDLKKVVNGYSNRTLYIDLGRLKIESKPVSQKMKDTFTGGKGFVCGYYGMEQNLQLNGMIQKMNWFFRQDLLVVSPCIPAVEKLLSQRYPR
jgi:aldehyde:ferredoxin oxidoreductase